MAPAPPVVARKPSVPQVAERELEVVENASQPQEEEDDENVDVNELLSAAFFGMHANEAATETQEETKEQEQAHVQVQEQEEKEQDSSPEMIQQAAKPMMQLDGFCATESSTDPVESEDILQKKSAEQFFNGEHIYDNARVDEPATTVTTPVSHPVKPQRRRRHDGDAESRLLSVNQTSDFGIRRSTVSTYSYLEKEYVIATECEGITTPTRHRSRASTMMTISPSGKKTKEHVHISPRTPSCGDIQYIHNSPVIGYQLPSMKKAASDPFPSTPQHQQRAAYDDENEDDAPADATAVVKQNGILSPTKAYACSDKFQASGDMIHLVATQSEFVATVQRQRKVCSCPCSGVVSACHAVCADCGGHA